MKYKGNLNTKLPFLQNDKNSLTTFLHSTDLVQPVSIKDFDFIWDCKISHEL